MKKAKLKILFINPPLSVGKEVKYASHQIPLGFMYMAGVLEKEGFVVKILDCPLYYKKRRKIDEKTSKIGLYPKEIERQIKNFDPDIVGVNCSFTMFEQDAFEAIDIAKKAKKDAFIVVGGAHASSNAKLVLRNSKIDLAILGEGELTILEIMQKMKNKKTLENIRGTAFIKNNKFIKNSPREPIKNLDNLEPAWHRINFKKYFEHPDNSGITLRGPSINIITSRGCPMNCIFCSVRTVWGRKYRAMSTKKVLDQIEFLYKKYKIKHFRFNDDNLTLNKKRTIEICQGIIDRGINIKWDTPSGVAFWTLDKEILSLMKKSGYYRITFGIESGSKNTQKYIRKDVDLKKIDSLIEHCHKIGLWVASFFIIGFPFEKKEEIEKTIKYITNSKINFPFVFVAQPYPGTEMYEDFKNNNLLEKGVLKSSTPIHSKYRSKYFAGEELNVMRGNIYKKFYFKKIIRYTNPFIFYREFLSKIRSKEDIVYVYKILKNLLTIF